MILWPLRNTVIRHRAVHAGIATQTPDGLKVPVVRHAEARTLWDLADEIKRVSEAARTGKATKEELTGSTITVTSLGKLGGIVSTPIINAPEMGIIGVNKAIERPVVLNGAITARYVGPQFEDDLNTLPLGGYVVIDVALSRAVTRWSEVFVAIENLFDRTYTTGRTTDGVVSIGTPRSVRGGLRLAF